MKILVTGSAGFIGFHLARRLCEDGHTVVGVDNFNEYYDPALKRSRVAILQEYSQFTQVTLDVADATGVLELFTKHDFPVVYHLAAQAGVRYSLDNPQAYVRSNLVGFVNLLEGCRQAKVVHLIFASSSSVYGLNGKLPFASTDGTDHPASLYAATKKSNEVMAHSYSHLYGIPMTGLRFFTVYGPWGRPDMALFKFTKAIMEGRPLPVYNQGNSSRDFTYIDDVIEALCVLLEKKPGPDRLTAGYNLPPDRSSAPFRIYNVGNSRPAPLRELIACIERTTGRKAAIEILPSQPGDVNATFADIVPLHLLTGFAPMTGLEQGVQRFVEWFRSYYKV